jgi:hypothetical protein
MSTQLTLDLTLKHQREQRQILQDESWLDASDIARGIGFTMPVLISSNLHDALQAGQSEVHSGYNQRLYDALWMAHFKLFLNNKQGSTFSFTLPRKGWKTEEISDISLRVRVITMQQAVLIGLLQDFSEAL